MFEFELRPHPARQKVFGKLVPLITDVQTLYVKDAETGKFIQCGYCGCEPGRPVSFTRNFPQVFVDAAKAFVTAKVGPPSGMSVPPVPQVLDDGDDE